MYSKLQLLQLSPLFSRLFAISAVFITRTTLFFFFRRATLLDMLIQAKLEDEEFASVGERDIITMMIDFVLAGSDTSSNTLSYAVAELINHPDIAQDLYKEIDTKIDQNHGITTADIPSLEFLDAVVHETLRHHPPVPLALPHQIVEPIAAGKYNLLPGVRKRRLLGDNLESSNVLAPAK